MERGVLVSPVRVEHSTFVVWNIAVWKHNGCQRKRKSWRNVQGTQDRNSSSTKNECSPV